MKALCLRCRIRASFWLSWIVREKMRIDLIIIKNKQVPYLYSQRINFHEWFISAFAILVSGFCSQWARRGDFRRPYCHIKPFISQDFHAAHSATSLLKGKAPHDHIPREASALIPLLSTLADMPSEFPPLSVRVWVLSHQMIPDFPRSEVACSTVVYLECCKAFAIICHKGIWSLLVLDPSRSTWIAMKMTHLSAFTSWQVILRTSQTF